MKVRHYSILSLTVIALLMASFANATTIPHRSTSAYGVLPTDTALFVDTSVTPVTIDGFNVSLVCGASSGGLSCSGSDDFLSVITPNLAPGTVVDISGVKDVGVIFCEGSFIGGCTTESGGMLSEAPLTLDQTACVNSLSVNAGFSGNTFQFTAPGCSLASKNGNSVQFLFDEFGITALPQLTFTTNAVSTAEPGSLLLLGVGLFAFCAGRKLLLG